MTLHDFHGISWPSMTFHDLHSASVTSRDLPQRPSNGLPPQVLLNLMQNAARFTKQGFVCVRCMAERADGGGLAAHFAVLDTGSGISEATKVFCP